MPEQKAKSRTILAVGWMVIGVAVLIVGGIFAIRWQQNRDLEYRAAERKRAEERAAAERTVETLGGQTFNIINFYAAPGTLRRGESADMCYGVSNAKTVKLDPPVASMWPSVNRCFSVSPTKDTTYTLTAEDGAGNTKTATLTLTVR